jgi:gluconokinase
MVLLLMGVSGAGKTTVGQALAQQLRCRFVDADDYHSSANVTKMRDGIPLSDEDRAPWLQSLRRAITEWLASGQNVVLACSALKAAYRKVLMIGPEVKLVYLRASRELIAERLASRRDHYMNPKLIDSQFAALEEPRDALAVDASLAPETIVDKICCSLSP